MTSIWCYKKRIAKIIQVDSVLKSQNRRQWKNTNISKIAKLRTIFWRRFQGCWEKSICILSDLGSLSRQVFVLSAIKGDNKNQHKNIVCLHSDLKSSLAISAAKSVPKIECVNPTKLKDFFLFSGSLISASRAFIPEGFPWAFRHFLSPN